MKPQIIFILPAHFKLYEGIEKNLEETGFNIRMLFLTDNGFSYKNTYQKFQNFLHKTFLNDKTYKENLRIKSNDEQIAKAVESVNEIVDYIVIIRPDHFSKNTLQKLKKKSKKMVAYQWDGIKRYPIIKDYIHIFDIFYVFDEDDFIDYKDVYKNIKPITNFYLDYFQDNEVVEKEKIFFIGSYLENRIEPILKIAKYFKSINYEADIRINYFRKKTPSLYPDSNINFISKAIPYLETLKYIAESKIVLDFANNIHNGLSFRTFEALFYGKKLITNNPIVKRYDFFNANNIFIWNEENMDEIENFLQLPYMKIDDAILKKYSFTNWIRYALEIAPFTPLNFPEK